MSLLPLLPFHKFHASLRALLRWLYRARPVFRRLVGAIKRWQSSSERLSYLCFSSTPPDDDHHLTVPAVLPAASDLPVSQHLGYTLSPLRTVLEASEDPPHLPSDFFTSDAPANNRTENYLDSVQPPHPTGQDVSVPSEVPFRGLSDVYNTIQPMMPEDLDNRYYKKAEM